LELFFWKHGSQLKFNCTLENNEAMYPFCTFVKDILAISAFKNQKGTTILLMNSHCQKKDTTNGL
jgi:hypothetical protein